MAGIWVHGCGDGWRPRYQREVNKITNPSAILTQDG
jgi:hypothetical protein